MSHKKEPVVMYKDKNIIVLVKPAGLLMHPFRVGTDKGKVVVKEETLADWLRLNYPETKVVGDNPEMRPGIVHRLDRETSGLVIVVRNQSSFDFYKSLFQSRGIHKTYYALVSGILRERQGRIEKAISLKPGTIKRTVHGGKMTKEAVTEYEVIETFSLAGNSFTLLKVHPLTGRTHQIRVHLASIGHPILGDTLYGSGKRKEEQALKPSRLMLHSGGLSFKNEAGDLIEIESPFPADFKEVLTSLKTQER